MEPNESTALALAESDPQSVRDELMQLRDASSQWCLAHDVALQNVIEQISRRINQRQKQVEFNLGLFSLDVERASTRLANVINDFHALSYTQFMEHRVYDEDPPVALDKLDPPTKERPLDNHAQAEDDPAILVSEYAALVRNGLQALASFSMPGDAPNELAPPCTLSELSYPEVALPYVIGTPEFQMDDRCGIFAMDERQLNHHTTSMLTGTGLAVTAAYCLPPLRIATRNISLPLA